MPVSLPTYNEPKPAVSLAFKIGLLVFLQIVLLVLLGPPLLGRYLHMQNVMQRLSPSAAEQLRIEKRRTRIAKKFGLPRSQVEVFDIGVNIGQYVVLHLRPQDLHKPSRFTVENVSPDELKTQIDLVLEHRPEPDFGPLVVTDTLLRCDNGRIPYDTKRRLAMTIESNCTGDGPCLPF